MNRNQLNEVAVKVWPQMHNAVAFCAPEVLGHYLYERTDYDALSCVLYQLYEKRDVFMRCVATGTDWPAPPGRNYPGNYNSDALRLMDAVDNKEAWQYRLCAHFRESAHL